MATQRTTDRQICPHCDTVLSKKTLKAHRALYYDEVTNQWVKKRCKQDPPCEFDEPSLELSAFDSLEDTDSSHCSPPPPLVDISDEPLDSDYLCMGSPDHSMDKAADFSDSESDSEEDIQIELWSDDDDDKYDECDEAAECFQTSDGNDSAQPSALILWLVRFLLLLQSIYHLTDRVLDTVFRFFKAFLSVLSRLYPETLRLSQIFPNTLYSARNMMGFNTASFKRFVVCKKCHAVYYLSDCIQRYGSHDNAKTCNHIPFGQRQQKCNTQLLKTVELATGRKMFYPIMTYCYVDLQTSLQHLLQRTEASLLNKWKERVCLDDHLSEVYDGRIWKQFVQSKFFDSGLSIACMINCDWFQPYKHLNYSVGVIYLTVLNLPVTLRNKLENVILVGILPGPKEPKRDINSFLDPLVCDLLKLWKGVELTVCPNKTYLVRCAVLSVCCDLPAGRKLCGFLSFSANYGCSKCYKIFPGAVGEKDYSGFNRQQWSPRTNKKHREHVDKQQKCTTLTERTKLESQTGCRYSLLLKLPYFDPVAMLAVDPMHCIFLGLAKHHLQIWISQGILAKQEFTLIQERIDTFAVPPDIGRIPCKIQSGFSSFTAEQFKNWVLYFSIICLRGLLAEDHIECWRHLVLACRILCLKSITTTQLTLADALLLRYCSRTERLYGKASIIPNMHFSCHLRECVLDYGPMHNFWAFAFERFNGTLGKLPNNNRSIEVQMMNRFLTDAHMLATSSPGLFKEDFDHLVPSSERKSFENVAAESGMDFQAIERMITFPKTSSLASFHAHEIDQLCSLYSTIYDCPATDIQVHSMYKRYTTLTVRNTLIGSHKSRSRSSSIAIAESKFRMFRHSSEEERPVRINYFAMNSVTVGSNVYTHLLVSVDWFKAYQHKDALGKPVSIWEPDVFELSNHIPIRLLKYRAAFTISKLDDHGNVLFITPLLDELFH